MNELVSTYLKVLIDNALDMYALANMERAQPKKGHMDTAAAWMPHLERNMWNIKNALKNYQEAKDE